MTASQPSLILLVVPPLIGDEAAALSAALAGFLELKLRAAGYRLFPPEEAQASLEKLVAFEELDAAERRRAVDALELAAVPRAFCGRFLIDDEQIRASFAYLALGEEPIRLRGEGVADRFFEVLDSIVEALLDRLPADEDGLEAARFVAPTRSFPAFRALARACLTRRFTDELGPVLSLVEESRVHDPEYADPLRFLAELWRDEGAIEEELAALRLEAELYPPKERPADRAEALMRQARALVHHERWEEALAVYLDSEELWRRAGQQRPIAQARANRATIQLRRGDTEGAIAEYEAALLAIGDAPEDQAQVLYNLGIALEKNGDREAGLTRLNQALDHARGLRNPPLICRIHNAIGAIYDDLGEAEDLDQAIRHYRMAEEFFSEDDDRSLLAGIKDHIAITYRKLGRLDEALEYSEQACELLADEGEEHRAIAYLNRAGLLSELKRYEEAAALADEAARLFEKRESPLLDRAHRLLERLHDADDLGFSGF